MDRPIVSYEILKFYVINNEPLLLFQRFVFSYKAHPWPVTRDKHLEERALFGGMESIYDSIRGVGKLEGGEGWWQCWGEGWEAIPYFQAFLLNPEARGTVQETGSIPRPCPFNRIPHRDCICRVYRNSQ